MSAANRDDERRFSFPRLGKTTVTPDDDIVYKVVTLIADAKDECPLELTPLYNENIPIDLLANAPIGIGDWSFNFDYDEYNVRVASTGEVIIRR